MKRRAVNVPWEVGLAEQGLELGREADPPLPEPVVERLDAEAVARQQQATLAPIPDREREHATQARHERRAVVEVEMQQDLGVAMRPETHAAAFQLSPQLEVIQDFAVVG